MCFVFVLHVFVCILLHIDAVTPITVSWLLHAYFNSKLGFFSFCFYSTLIIYLAMKIPCLLFFLQQLVFLRRVLYFIIHFFLILLYCSPSLSVLSLFDIFDSLSVHFHIIILLYGSLVLLRQFIIAFVFFFSILTKIQPNINNRNFPVLDVTFA